MTAVSPRQLLYPNISVALLLATSDIHTQTASLMPTRSLLTDQYGSPILDRQTLPHPAYLVKAKQSGLYHLCDQGSLDRNSDGSFRSFV